MILYRSGVVRPVAVDDGQLELSRATWPVVELLDTGERLVLRIDHRPAGGTYCAVALDHVNGLELIQALLVGLDMSLGELVDRLVNDVDHQVPEPRDVETVQTGGLL